MTKAVTIQSIAAQLNLSRNTVAKALNGHHVPERTRLLVLKKAQEMGYKSLNSTVIESNKRYRLLLVSGKPISSMSYFVSLVKGIDDYCYANNYDFFQYTYNIAKTSFDSFAEYVKQLNVDGIVAIECFDKEFVNKLLDLGKPICFNDFTAADVNDKSNYDIITTNDEKSICDVVNLLYRKYKVKNFTFVGDYKHCLSFKERYFGMLRGLLNIQGIHSKKDDILCNDETFDYGDANAIANEIAQLKYKTDCYVCCNDFVARNVCKALESLNLRVPQDAMIVGFDNVAESVAFNPQITSFSIDKELLGKETIRTLISRIENHDTPSRMVTVRTAMMLRESTERDTDAE